MSRYLDTVRQLSTSQKSARGAPAYSRFVNRRLGRLLAAGAFLAGLTPNAVTLVSAAFTYTAIVLLAAVAPSVGLGIAVCLLLVLGYAFDSADGQVARLGGGGSVRGEWLDHVVDSVKVSSLHIAVLIAFYRGFHLGHRGLLLVPIAFGITASVWFFALILTEKLRPARAPIEGPPSAVRALLVLPTDYGVFCLLFLVLGLHQVFLVVYILVFLANLVLTAASLAKWYRDMPGPVGRRPADEVGGASDPVADDSLVRT